MLHWQLSELFKNIGYLSKRQFFFIQLCCLVLFLHLMFLGVIIVCSYGLQTPERFTVSLQSKSAVYVLSPLQKHVEQNNKKNKNRKKSVKASKIIDEQTYKKEQKKQQDISVKAEQKPVLEISNVREVVEPSIVETKSILQKKNEHSVKKSSVRLQDATTIDDKQEFSEKIVTEKKIEKELSQSDLDLEDVAFIGYKDLDHLMVQEMIAQAVQVYFKPPAGMNNQVSVELRVQIGNQGNVVKIDVIRSSGIIVYDSSARAAVHKATLPRQVWNKTVSIVLGQ